MWRKGVINIDTQRGTEVNVEEKRDECGLKKKMGKEGRKEISKEGRK